MDRGRRTADHRSLPRSNTPFRTPTMHLATNRPPSADCGPPTTMAYKFEDLEVRQRALDYVDHDHC